MAMTVVFCSLLERTAFVEVFPAEEFDETETVIYAEGDFCSKFCVCPGFTPNDGAYMGLVYADNAVVYPVGAVLVHFQLLLVEEFQDTEAGLLSFQEQCLFRGGVSRSCNVFQVSAKVAELFPEYIALDTPLFSRLEVLFSCSFTGIVLGLGVSPSRRSQM